MSLEVILSPHGLAHKRNPRSSHSLHQVSQPQDGWSQGGISASLSVAFSSFYRISRLESKKECDFYKELADTRGVHKQLTSNYSRSWGKGIE